MSVDLGRSCGICGMYVEGRVVVAFIGSFQTSIRSAGISLEDRRSIARALFYRHPLYTTTCTICMNRVLLSHGVSSSHYETSTKHSVPLNGGKYNVPTSWRGDENVLRHKLGLLK